MDFNKKQKSEQSLKVFFIKAAAFFIIFVLVFLIIADIKIYKRRKSLELEVAKYEKKIQQLKEENNNLEEKINNSDNPDYIEKIAREEQDMQKPGENVVSFIMPEEKKQESVNENFWDTNNWLSRIKNWFMGLF